MRPAVETVSHCPSPGVLFWQIAGPWRGPVEAELCAIQFDPLVARSEFFRPWRERDELGRVRWRCTGYSELR